MNTLQRYALGLASVVLIFCISAFTFIGGTDPWTEKELMEPDALAKILNDSKQPQPVIINTGPTEMIQGAVSAGTCSTDEGMKHFRQIVNSYGKDQTYVIYCGCCSTDHCPNIRPAFQYLKDAGFTNAKVLNLRTGLSEDWVSKGYPMTQ